MKTPLYKCRKKEGLTQLSLARYCGSSSPTISRLEAGKTDKVSAAVCMKLIERYQSKGLKLEHLMYPFSYPEFIEPTK